MSSSAPLLDTIYAAPGALSSDLIFIGLAVVGIISGIVVAFIKSSKK